METEIDLDEMIQKLFPWSLLALGIDNDQAINGIYKAYTQGFKDGWARRNPDATIKIVRPPTIGERLHAAQQEGSEDTRSDGEVLRKEKG